MFCYISSASLIISTWFVCCSLFTETQKKQILLQLYYSPPTHHICHLFCCKCWTPLFLLDQKWMPLGILFIPLVCIAGSLPSSNWDEKRTCSRTCILGLGDKHPIQVDELVSFGKFAVAPFRQILPPCGFNETLQRHTKLLQTSVKKPHWLDLLEHKNRDNHHVLYITV